MLADVIVDLQYGDCGKGKVANHLCKINDYTHVIRYNGGCNAGHTIYHKGQKLVTHHIPCGVLHGIKSVIGPGCVLNVDQFFKEIEELEEAGIETKGLIKIASNVHIITDFHLAQDRRDTEIGTTKRGTGRPRQVNWLDLDMLEKASRINGVTKLVMNKVDVLEEVQFWKLYEGINAMEFSQGDYMLGYIEKFFQNINPDLEVLFSGNKEAI
jgi:adenylosuccinate synthase